MEGREEGRLEGRAEGEQHKAIEIARKLKVAGLDINTILQTTGLDLDVISNL